MVNLVAAVFLVCCANGPLWRALADALGSVAGHWLFLVMAGVVLAARHGAHITTTFLMEKLPFAARRPLTVLAWLGVAALYGVLAVQTFRML